VHRESLLPVPAATAVVTLLCLEPFEVLGGGDIEALRSALVSDDAPANHCSSIKKLDDMNEQVEEYRVFRRKDEYISAIHFKL